MSKYLQNLDRFFRSDPTFTEQLLKNSMCKQTFYLNLFIRLALCTEVSAEGDCSGEQMISGDLS